MKIIVITGASRGIGLATAKKFLTEGWRVVGTYLNTSIPLQHDNLITIKYDQGNPKSIAEAADQIKKLVLHIDVLINNAGIILDANDRFADSDKVRKTLEVNVVGVVNLTERLLHLFHKDSHIVNINSGYGAISYPILDDETSAGYRISKAALNMYTRHLAFRLKPRGVIVSSIAPGWVKTDMGYSVATDTEKPNREPEAAAEDIFQLATTVKESNHFWRLGKKTDW